MNEQEAPVVNEQRTAGWRALFVALEGGEAAGKSTQAAMLAETLGAVLTREPGGTALGRAIRALVLDGGDCDVRTEALLMAADRAEHLATVVRPALRDGRDVVTDRSSGSFWAYQGWGRSLGLDIAREIDRFATQGLEPDVFVLLDASASVRRARREAASDRMERESVEFHERVAEGFRCLAAADPARWCVVDGTGAAAEIHTRVLAAVARVRSGEPAAELAPDPDDLRRHAD